MQCPILKKGGDYPSTCKNVKICWGNINLFSPLNVLGVLMYMSSTFGNALVNILEHT